MALSQESLAKNFAQDVSPATTKIMFATQGPVAAKAFGEAVTVASWKNKPSYYIVAENDRMIQPELQKSMAKKIKSVSWSIRSFEHSIF